MSRANGRELAFLIALNLNASVGAQGSGFHGTHGEMKAVALMALMLVLSQC
jgi:hypothetical protein